MMPGVFFKIALGKSLIHIHFFLRKTHILDLLKNSDVKEMADRFGELYMDQGDTEYASAKIAVEKLNRGNCFYDFLANVLQTSSVFLIFFFFLQVHAYTSLKVYPSFCILYNTFY